MSRKWIAYGVTGALGVAVLSGGAVAAANALDLRTASGEVIADGAITGSGSARPADLESGSIALTAPTAGEQASPATPNSTSGQSAQSTKTPAEQVSAVSSPDASQNQTTTQPPAQSAPSPVESAPSPEQSAPSPVEPASPASPHSPDSVQSADSD